jgi:hypothetical protein
MLCRMHVGGRDRLGLAAAAVAGATVGHTLGYLLAVPDMQVRAAVLAQTGHAYWSMAVAGAIVFGVLAAVAVAVHHFRRGLKRQRPAPVHRDLGGLAWRLALLQPAIYVVHETLERLVVGAPLSGLFGHRLLLTGVVVQVLVAVGVAAVLTLLGRAAEAAGRALRPAPWLAPTPALSIRPQAAAHAARLLTGVPAIRAPPGR